jgi:hypothetical protein
MFQLFLSFFFVSNTFFANLNKFTDILLSLNFSSHQPQLLVLRQIQRHHRR